MKRTLLMLAPLLLLAGTSFGQTAPTVTARNALYLEAGGTGLVLSLNYERLLYQREPTPTPASGRTSRCTSTGWRPSTAAGK